MTKKLFTMQIVYENGLKRVTYVDKIEKYYYKNSYCKKKFSQLILHAIL